MLLQRAAELEEAFREEEEIYWTKDEVPEGWKEVVIDSTDGDANERRTKQDMSGYLVQYSARWLDVSHLRGKRYQVA